jgi:hypothetical protein
MGFFDDAIRPGPDDPDPQGHPWTLPARQLPKAAASGLLLAQTDAVAVAVSVIWAFREGIEFWVEAHFRDRQHPRDHLPDEESLHVGLEFADGRKAANIGGLPDPAGSEAAGLILSPRSFGAGLRHQHRSYWVWPLPPRGPLAFVCEWAGLGIPESRAEVDAQVILDAAEQSIQLWPAADN